MSSDTAAADARFVEWMRLNLQNAAEHFELMLSGEPIFGWRLRTIGAVTKPAVPDCRLSWWDAEKSHVCYQPAGHEPPCRCDHCGLP